MLTPPPNPPIFDLGKPPKLESYLPNGLYEPTLDPALSRLLVYLVLEFCLPKAGKLGGAAMTSSSLSNLIFFKLPFG